jgi:hypothetical protein
VERRGWHQGLERAPRQRRLDLQHPGALLHHHVPLHGDGRGKARGLEIEDVLKRVLDLVGLPIDGVRANLQEPPTHGPWRADTTAT